MSTPTIKDIRAAAAKRRSARQRNRRLLIGGAVTLGLLAMLSWFILPGVVRGQLQQRGREFTGRPVTVGDVALNPFSLTIEISDLAVLDHDGGGLLGWDRLMVNANLWATLTGSWGLDAIELEGLKGRLFMTEGGELNVADIIEKLSGGETPEGETEEGEARPLVVTRLAVTDAQLSLADSSRSRPFATTIGPLSFSIEDFHTKFDPEAPYKFEASTESGETLSWRGTLSVVPLKSSGDFVMSGIHVPKYEAYFADVIPFEVDAGLLGASGSYALEWTEELPDLKLVDGIVSVTGVTLSAREGRFGQQTLGRLELAGIAADVRAERYAVETILATDGSIEMRRSGDGLDLMGLSLGAEASVDETTTEQELAPAWPDLSVGEFTAERVRFRLRDDTLVESTVVGINLETVSLSGLTLADPAAPIAVALQASFPLGGQLQVEGKTSLEPFSPDLMVRLSDLSLMAAADHLRGLNGLELVRGAVSAEGRISGGEAGMGFGGDITVAELSVLDAAGETLAGIGGLELNGMDLRFAPPALTIGSVELTAPEAHLRRLADGSLNLPGAQDAATDAVTAPDRPTELPEIEIGRISVTGARLSFRDEKVVQAAVVSLDELAGELEGWSSQDIGRAKVAMTGKINGVSPMEMTGDLNPLGRPAHADLKIDVDRVDLLPTRGYVNQYAGFELIDGRLSLDIAFQLRDRAIDSDTMTVLDQFTLGAKTDSPDAVNLPVKLGVALLKDPAGEIVIDVPVAGHLDDPEFRIGRVVWRVITNLLTKAATSPFALLGGVVGGADKVDLEHHVFAPGQGTVSAETLESLTPLVTALEARPEIEIGIRGEYDPRVDPGGLRPVVLENMLRQRAGGGALTAAGDWVGRSREAALVALYEEVFGEPPIDPTGEVPPVAEPGVEESAGPSAPADPVSPAESAGDQTLIALIRRLFRGSPDASPEPPSPGAAAAGAPPTSFPLPAGVEPELPVLPMGEIEDRLLERIDVPETALVGLARQRAEATRDHLVAAGIAAGRLTLADSASGETRVTLDLR